MTHSIYADFHVHSHLSPCGKPQATAAAMIHRAREMHLSAIGFADHFTPAAIPGCPFYDRQRQHILSELRAEIAQVNGHPGVEVLVGVEADYTIAGRACLDPAILDRADHVICASSHFHLRGAPRPSGHGPRAKAELMLRLSREALAMSGVSIWAHPFDCSRMRPLSPIMGAIGDDELAVLVRTANAHQVAIEINGGPAQRDDYRLAVAPFFHIARDMGARFTITADAHHPDDFARLDLALNWSRRMGFRDRDLLTTAELRERQRERLECPVSLASGQH